MGNGYTPDITPGGDRDRPKLGLPHLRLDGSRLTSLEQGGTRLSCVWAGLGLAVVGIGTAVFGRIWCRSCDQSTSSTVFYFWKSCGLFVQSTRVALRIGWTRLGSG